MDARLPARFWNKVIPITECGCWVWMGAVNAKQYGRYEVQGKNRFAHRVAYEQIIGRIPDGLHLDHTCRITCCVNPAHLEPVTNAENLQRGLRARGVHIQCKHGHPIDGVTNRRQGTNCLACRANPEQRMIKAERERTRYWERKANAS